MSERLFCDAHGEHYGAEFGSCSYCATATRAKAEGWREGMLAAKKACQEASAGHSNPTAKRAALNCAEDIDALLLASSEAKDPTWKKLTDERLAEIGRWAMDVDGDRFSLPSRPTGTSISVGAGRCGQATVTLTGRPDAALAEEVPPAIDRIRRLEKAVRTMRSFILGSQQHVTFAITEADEALGETADTRSTR